MIAETAFLSRKKGALGKRSGEEYWRRDMETGMQVLMDKKVRRKMHKKESRRHYKESQDREI